MIHYHGGPITPLTAAIDLWRAKHACVSFARPDQVELAFEIAQSVMLDNGAFSFWQDGGGTVDLEAYAGFVRRWYRHPAFDWCLIPDVIDGTEAENDRLISVWRGLHDVGESGIPVWHLHESIERLQKLALNFPRVALGSSGQWATVGDDSWWQRMGEAMDAVCDDQGRPLAKLHGLRMLNPTVFSQLPLASADSTNVARNVGMDGAWDQSPYTPRSRAMRALVLAERIEHHASASRWTRSFGHQFNMEVLG